MANFFLPQSIVEAAAAVEATIRAKPKTLISERELIRERDREQKMSLDYMDRLMILPPNMIANMWASLDPGRDDGPWADTIKSTAVLDRPTAAPYVLPEKLPSSQYLQTAARIGLMSPPIAKARLVQFFAVNGWLVYPYDKVWAYLQSLARQETQRERDRLGDRPGMWGPPTITPFWAPLRAKDIDRKESVAPYDKAVPEHALDKVEALETAEETRDLPLRFFVSDYKSVRPDPFLAVSVGGEYFVIDVWDEPGW